MSNDGSVYLDRDPRPQDNKHDVFFNESGNMADPHGHVVHSADGQGYDYVRDVDGNVYINR